MPADITNWTQPAYRRWLKPYIWDPMGTSTAWTTVARVYLMEVEITEAQKVDGISFYNYATVAGNCYVGVYGPVVTEDTAAGAARIAISADTVLAGASAAQFVPFTAPVTLAPGRYYLAMECSDATYTYARITNQPPWLGMSQYFLHGGGVYGALDATVPAVTDGTNALSLSLRVYKA